MVSSPRPDPGADSDFFDDAYYRLLAPFHTAEGARREIAGLRELVGLAQSDRVLDLGCGWGRHTTLLAGAGHRVVGVDLSASLLRRARAAAGPAGSAASFVGADMRRLPLASASFDVVLNLATSLGLFLDDGEAEAALREAARVLIPGGRFLLEGMHRENVEPRFAPRDAWTLDDGTRVRARRRFDARRGISHEVLRWEGPGGEGRKRHSLRVRTANELAALMDAAGLGEVERWGDWSASPFSPGAERVILLAERH